MNIIFIPSWYPTLDHPIVGIFVRDQAISISKHYPQITIGISIWGSHVEDLLLKKNDHIKILPKLIRRSKYQPYSNELSNNCIEYFTPSYTWTRSIHGGNIQGIIQANLTNIARFEEQHGKIDLIHAHIGHPGGYVAAHIADLYNVPYIITEQMSPFPLQAYLDGKGKLNKWLRKAYDNSCCNISVGNAQLKTMSAHGVLNQKYIPNLVDESVFYPEPKVNPDQKPVGFSFFALGRLEEQKGFDLLLEAFHIVIKKHPKTCLTIGGSGSLDAQLRNLCNRLGLSDRVTWKGELNRNSAVKYFNECNAFILSSRHESFGIVLCEALACGKPIVTTLCGGPEDILDDSVGLGVATDDPQDLSKKMIRMIENYSKYEPSKIRHYFEKRFSSGVVAAQIVEIYNQIIGD